MTTNAMQDMASPKYLATVAPDMTDEQLSALPHATLYQMRQYVPNDQQDLQNRLADFEHRAFAREVTANSPAMALPVGAAIPFYGAYKAAAGAGRSQGSLNQLLQGYAGIGEGLKQYASNLLTK